MSADRQLEGPRLSIDSDNRAALIVIVSAIGLSWTFLTLVIRLASKLHIKRTIGLEEALVIVSSVIAGLSSACVLISVDHGLGQRNGGLRDEDSRTGLKSLWLSDILYLLALGLAKTAVLPLLIHLTRIRKFVIMSYALAIFTALWTILSIVMVAARCHLGDPWNDIAAKVCPSLYGRWVAIETVSLLIEILIFTVFVSIIHILKMRPAVKIKVALAFSTRLPVIVPTVFRLIYLREELRVDSDTYFALTNAVIATQTVLHYTTMAASFAYLKPFLRAFDSNLGATVRVHTLASCENTYNELSYPGDSRDQEKGDHRTSGYQLQPLQQGLKAQSIKRENSTSNVGDLSAMPQPSRPSTVHTDAPRAMTISTLGRGSQDYSLPKKYTSRESMAPMITKTQEWHVAVETRDPGDPTK